MPTGVGVVFRLISCFRSSLKCERERSMLTERSNNAKAYLMQQPYSLKGHSFIHTTSKKVLLSKMSTLLISAWCPLQHRNECSRSSTDKRRKSRENDVWHKIFCVLHCACQQLYIGKTA